MQIWPKKQTGNAALLLLRNVVRDMDSFCLLYISSRGEVLWSNSFVLGKGLVR